MDGNVCFVTERGLIFRSFTKEQCEKLADCVAELAAQREDGILYRFVIDFDDGVKIEAKDILMAYTPVRRRGDC